MVQILGLVGKRQCAVEIGDGANVLFVLLPLALDGFEALDQFCGVVRGAIVHDDEPVRTQGLRGNRLQGLNNKLRPVAPGHSREEIIRTLSENRKSKIENRKSLIADLAFYAGRFLDSCDWKPFFKAAFERNPVSIELFRDTDLALLYQQLQTWPDESIYDGNRLALPDEVVNFQRGDGIEKALTMVNIAKSRHIDVSWEQQAGKVIIRHGQEKYLFTTLKQLIVPLQ